MSLEDRALADYVEQHACRALAGIAQLGAELPVEVVHSARTSLRRLRATVRTFPGAVADPAAADTALQALALPLGAVRDVDVLAELLPPALDATDAGPAREEARDLLEDELRSRRRSALQALQEAASTRSWHDGSTLLRIWCRTPPALPVPEAAEVLDRAEDEVRRRLRAAHGDPAGLHAARKAAKRWRYAAELLAASPGADARRERAEAMQELLGEVQDLEIAGALLGELLTGHAVGPGPDPGSSAGARTRTSFEELRTLLSRHQREVIARVVDAI